MDDSWRFRPIQGSICPACSISHFPFCYQPPPFNQFPSNPPLNRPVLDPSCDNRGIPRTLSHFGNDGFGMREPLNRNQSFDNRGLQPNPNFGYGGNGFVRGEFVESDRNHKRMRVGDMSSIPVSGSFVQMPPPFGGYSVSNHGKISSEDERRLSLIRDHGAPSNAMQLHVGSNGYMHESSRSCWQPRFSGNDKMTSFPDFRFGSADRTGPTQSMVFDEKKELQRGGSDLGFGHQTQMPKNMQSDVDAAGVGSREESGKEVLFESQKEQSQHPGYGAATYITPSQHIMNSSALRQENKHHQWGDHAFYPLQNDGHSQHSHDGHQQLLPNNFGQANQLQHPQGNNLLASSNSHISVGKTHNLHYHDLRNDTRSSFDVKYQSMENINTPVRSHNLPNVEQSGLFRVNQPGTYLHVSATNNVVPARQSQMTSSQPVVVHPPLPPLPPHPRQYDSPGAPPLHLQVRSSSPNVSSVYPGSTASSVTMPLSSLPLEGQPYMPKHPSPDKPKVVDASRLFLPPDRATRPDHIVIILRGFPGSGKSYLAKKLRDLEVENGGSAPRIHSMDDYFMTEVEKVEEVDNPSMAKGKKRTMKKVMEYCYEPEMEEAYRSSMLKAFKKTLEEGIFTFVIVDDRNLRVADFAQFWASAKRLGYEVYLLEASYKDPMGCAARNVHGFTSDDVHKMAELWEEAPSLYLQLDVQSLFCGDNLKESEIQEVEMDMEDASSVGGSSELSNNYSLKVKEPPVTQDCAPEAEGSFKDERWDAEGDDPTRVKELGRSKWSHDEDEEDNERVEGGRGNSNALSGLIKAYSKGEKSVHWGDQVGKTGFSIGAAKKATSLSLIIGPGAGYNLKSNPPAAEENATASEHGWQSKKRNVFEEQLRAERESFRAVFDRRRHRIGGLDTDDE